MKQSNKETLRFYLIDSKTVQKRKSSVPVVDYVTMIKTLPTANLVVI